MFFWEPFVLLPTTYFVQSFQDIIYVFDRVSVFDRIYNCNVRGRKRWLYCYVSLSEVNRLPYYMRRATVHYYHTVKTVIAINTMHLKHVTIFTT